MNLSKKQILQIVGLVAGCAIVIVIIVFSNKKETQSPSEYASSNTTNSVEISVESQSPYTSIETTEAYVDPALSSEEAAEMQAEEDTITNIPITITGGPVDDANIGSIFRDTNSPQMTSMASTIKRVYLANNPAASSINVEFNTDFSSYRSEYTFSAKINGDFYIITYDMSSDATNVSAI